MRRGFLIFGAVFALGLAALWAFGGFSAAERFVLESQRSVQGVLAGAVRKIRAGQSGALWALLSVCFTYGVLHAAGPGHGKLLIGGYGVGRRVAFARLSGLALLSSLAQSAVAVVLVYAGVALLGQTRDQMEGVAETIVAPLGTAAIGAVGLWLFIRGIRGLRKVLAKPASPAGRHHHDHHHHHHHDHAEAEACGCGHAHGPSLQEAAAITGWRDATALIAGIALRPCSGALFLLILTWQMGIGAAGIAGAFAMGLGTALVTIGVAALAVWAREGVLETAGLSRAAKLLPFLEAFAGGVIVVICAAILMQSL